VTTPLGIAAYTGVPLTHRDHTSAVTFVTGHAVEAIDWAKVGHAETLVIFMGLTNFAEIARRLMAHGRSAETPAMAVRWATRADQQTIVGTLESLPALVAGMKPPATIIVGEVVRLREKLDWFERLPLFGKRIVVTRAREQADAGLRYQPQIDEGHFEAGVRGGVDEIEVEQHRRPDRNLRFQKLSDPSFLSVWWSLAYPLSVSHFSRIPRRKKSPH